MKPSYSLIGAKVPQESASRSGGFTMLVNFIGGECKNIVLFLVGFKDTLSGAALFWYSSRIPVKDVCDNSENLTGITEQMTIEQFFSCMKSDITQEFLSPSPDFTGKCFSTEHNDWAYWFLAVAAVCGLLVWVELFLLVVFHVRCYSKGIHSTFKSGRYLAFCWRVFQTWSYTIVSYFLVFLAGLVVLCTVVAGFLKEGGIRFIMDQITSLVTILLGAYGLAKTKTPAFAADSDKFGGLVFQRSLKDMVMQSADSFATQLEHALYRAHIGDVSELKGMIDFKAMGYDEFDDKTCKDIISLMGGQ